MLSPKGIDRFHKLSLLIKNTKNPFKNNGNFIKNIKDYGGHYEKRILFTR